MIPKKINYCWFGKKTLPKFAKRCIASWKKCCPDYEIIEWNETNYDIYKNDYIREAYKAKKWAFISDFARLDIIYNNGGFYLDTDVELIRNLDCFISLEGFLASDEHGINTGIGFGAEKNNKIIKQMLDLYKGKHFIINSKLDLTPCTEINTKIFLQHGYSPTLKETIKIKDITIFPTEYFCPIKGTSSELKITKNTYAIHWSSLSWETGLTKIKANLRLILGLNIVNKIKKIFKFFYTIGKALCF